jgi:hypothetical protein
MTCSICGAVGETLACFTTSVTSESARMAAGSELRLCTRCGLLHTHASIDWEAYYANQYDAKLTADGVDEIVSNSDGAIVFRTDVDYEQMRRLLGTSLQRSTRVFEYGCGRARILSRLYRDGHRSLAAFDLSESYRSEAARYCGEHIYIKDRPSLRCELAFSLFVIEHDTSPLESIRYLHSVIDENGFLYAVVPNYRTNIIDLACADHVNHFSSDTFCSLLEGSGFSVCSVDEQGSIGAMAVVAQRRAIVGFESIRERSDLVTLSRNDSTAFIEYLRSLRAVGQKLRRDRPVWLYGAGFYGALVSSELTSAGHVVRGVFDANPRKTGTSFLGHVVRHADELNRADLGDAQLIMCVNPRIAPSIAQRFAGSVGAVVMIGTEA